MTASARPLPRLTSSAIPSTQNTAPVLEFRCLYTHDLRQKKKRWQDGYLKFHTFNKRVMIYDTSRNYVADTYWKDTNELQEGDELGTERVLIQVEEAIGTTQTDLDSVLKKRSPQSKPVPRPLPRPTAPSGTIGRSGLQLKHKSLNTLLGTPKGPIGKSVPITSPYERRQEKENEWAQQKPAKRQKLDHSPAVAPSSSLAERAADKLLVPWGRSLDIKKTTATPKSAAEEPSVVVLDSISDRTSTDPLSPPYKAYNRKPAPAVTSFPTPALEPQKQAAVRTTPKLPARKAELPRPKADEATAILPMNSSPPVSVTNHLSKAVDPVEPAAPLLKEPTPPKSPRRDPRARSLKLFAGPRREMLLCQSFPPPVRSISPAEPRQKQERRPRKKPKENYNAITEQDEFGSLPVLSDDEMSRLEDVPVHHESKSSTLKKRTVVPKSDKTNVLSRMPQPRENPTPKSLPSKAIPMPSSSLDRDEPVFEESPPRPSGPIISKKRKSGSPSLAMTSTKKAKVTDPLLSSSPPAFDGIETVHGIMDRQSIPRKSPQPKTVAKTKSPPVVKAAMPKAVAKKKVQKNTPSGQDSLAPSLGTKAGKAKKKAPNQELPVEGPTSPTSPVMKPSKPKKVTKATIRKAAAQAANIVPTDSASPAAPPAAPPVHITIPDSPLSERSVSLTPPLQSPSLPASRSISPHKNPLSKRGFPKKDVQNPKPVPEIDNTKAVRRAPVLPPPFVTNKRKRAATDKTTSAELERPLKAASLADDPIEDDDQPNKPVKTTEKVSRFRRVRSTSDVPDEPIPSASEQWEHQNLSRTKLELEDTSHASVPAISHKLKATSGLAALVQKTDPRKKFQRVQSLNVVTDIERAVASDIPSPPPDTDVGPWSTEAFDLLGWNPPNRSGEEDETW